LYVFKYRYLWKRNLTEIDMRDILHSPTIWVKPAVMVTCREYDLAYVGMIVSIRWISNSVYDLQHDKFTMCSTCVLLHDASTSVEYTIHAMVYSSGVRNCHWKVFNDNFWGWLKLLGKKIIKLCFNLSVTAIL